MNNKKDIPNKFECFGFVLGYNYELHKWVYDIKYYLNDNNWCLDPEGKMILRKINERELKMIEKYQHIIDERERENMVWLIHKQCRKRSCICKTCQKYCHCYECIGKINTCDDSTNNDSK